MPLPNEDERDPMRSAILADIHANLEAFTAVLEDIERRGGADEVWCLGDTVGYGPDPRECVALLRRVATVSVAGNHDLAVFPEADAPDFNPEAAAASHWTAGQLALEDRVYLGSLPETLVRGDFTLVHGSPRGPMWEYLDAPLAARQNLDYFSTPYCAVGHTHRPVIFNCTADGCRARHLVPDGPVALGEERAILNPGGVGQPRDGDPRASYAIYDDDARQIRLYRVLYDVATTQRKMQARGLPTRLITRLSYGL